MWPSCEYLGNTKVFTTVLGPWQYQGPKAKHSSITNKNAFFKNKNK